MIAHVQGPWIDILQDPDFDKVKSTKAQACGRERSSPRFKASEAAKSSRDPAQGF